MKKANDLIHAESIAMPGEYIMTHGIRNENPAWCVMTEEERNYGYNSHWLTWSRVNATPIQNGTFDNLASMHREIYVSGNLTMTIKSDQLDGRLKDGKTGESIFFSPWGTFPDLPR